ncbi:anthranilate synthase component 1 [Diaminobutyricimonas aerilata]|uniref:Anthranilate synthase component 1 n=1 Tax=Diaminobutyricimonas aerilata TaxID=1162967 RepID=A0A2M9CJC2_9MICO|nr:anthranilate synthase component I family protein [Diaminobutyricimonas aerilata]PJJ72000.1 anthranilate synthase component 1 [Diaminobutyricimonas aerilata]
MRVLRHPVAWVDPAAAYAALHRDDPHSFWLDTAAPRPGEPGRTFLGGGTPVVGPDPLSVLERAPGAEVLGWVGWLGYGYARGTLELPALSESDLPDAGLLEVSRLIRFDHATRTVELIVAGDAWTPEALRWRDETVTALRNAAPVAPRAAPTLRPAHWRTDDESYLAAIGECLAAIRRGDAYQLCLTDEARVATDEHPLDLYVRLRERSPSHRAALLRTGDVALLSASPERFLSIGADGRVSTSPIKGTRRRDPRADVDDRLRHELLASDKERAENLMIVDLMRNDLARVCEVGSVAVESLFDVESYPQVHQLVSTVTGRLASGRTTVDAVRAVFPAGSMTGAPKRRAVELLDALERRPRGPYAGAFGFLRADGPAELAMTIRTIVLADGVARVGSGGGITAPSDPLEELEEKKLKARVLLEVLGSR